MRKLNKKQKLIILISIATIIAILGLIIGANVIRNNIANNSYESSNSGSSNRNLLPEYIKKGITLGGVTGTLESLDTSDATATPEDILEGKTAYVDGKKITGTMKEIVNLGSLEIGDYVAYTPDSASSYSLSSSYSGYSRNQTISQQSFKWRVLSVNDDGTVDLISETPTSTSIIFSNAVGYNNAVYLLNDISASLYSNDSLGVTARSINIEDIENHMTSAGLEYVHSYASSVAWGQTKTYTIQNFSSYPNLYRYEVGSGISTTVVNTNGAKPSDSYYSRPTTEDASQGTSLTVTQTFYNQSLSSGYYDNSIFYDLIHSGNTYWVASRYVNTSASVANFGIRYVNGNNLNGNVLFGSNYLASTSDSRCIRIVVSLSASIQLDSGDGSSSSPYQIAE